MDQNKDIAKATKKGEQYDRRSEAIAREAIRGTGFRRMQKIRIDTLSRRLEVEDAAKRSKPRNLSETGRWYQII